jgi:hypothetical protein
MPELFRQFRSRSFHESWQYEGQYDLDMQIKYLQDKHSLLCVFVEASDEYDAYMMVEAAEMMTIIM